MPLPQPDHCRGELRNEDVTARVASETDGTVLVQETVRTQDNGFVGFWLPADQTATLTLEHEGRTASTPITTGADAPTCLTTLQLRRATPCLASTATLGSSTSAPTTAQRPTGRSPRQRTTTAPQMPGPPSGRPRQHHDRSRGTGEHR